MLFLLLHTVLAVNYVTDIVAQEKNYVNVKTA